MWYIMRYWDSLAMVARAGGYHSSPFKWQWGVTQGALLLPTLLNVVLDVVVQYWLLLVGIEDVGLEGWGRDIHRR